MPQKSKVVEQLTAREKQVVILIGKNKKYREIADELGLGYETVKTYVTRIRKKLALSSKLAVGLWAHQKGLVE
jgi:DNA-binding CsgD family transcriptional regulator